MNWKTKLVAVSMTACLTSPSLAGGFWHQLFASGCGVPDCIGKYCCDDYVPKRLPCVDVPLCFGCDDYCPKRLPCVDVPLCFGCDDYHPKCQPTIQCPTCRDLKCGPPAHWRREASP